MYNSVDLIEENNRQKRIQQDFPDTQGYPVEHKNMCGDVQQQECEFLQIQECPNSAKT